MTELDIKAREIVISFQFQSPPLNFDVAKNCALIHVSKMIKEYDEEIIYQGYDFDIPMREEQRDNWIKLKTIIEKL